MGEVVGSDNNDCPDRGDAGSHGLMSGWIDEGADDCPDRGHGLKSSGIDEGTEGADDLGTLRSPNIAWRNFSCCCAAIAECNMLGACTHGTGRPIIMLRTVGLSDSPERR